MGMTSDDLKKECTYCYREIDASGLEGFRCTNETVNRKISWWCRPKNANEPCSTCKYCKPRKEEMGRTIDEVITRYKNNAEIDEVITRYKNNAEFERTHGNLQGCLEFRQLVEWLAKLQKIEQILNDIPYGGDTTVRRIQEVIENGDDT